MRHVGKRVAFIFFIRSHTQTPKNSKGEDGAQTAGNNRDIHIQNRQGKFAEGKSMEKRVHGV